MALLVIIGDMLSEGCDEYANSSLWRAVYIPVLTILKNLLTRKGQQDVLEG